MKSENNIVIGHRGSRGLKPENTIPAFLKAIILGAKGLEMDLHITRDGKVVVTHDAYISAELCRTANGKPLKEDKCQQLIIFDLNFDDIKPFDCGTEPNPEFPGQENMEAHIPLLSEVIDAVSALGTTANDISFYMEFKSNPSTDFIYHPEPKEFAKRVVETLNNKDIYHRSLLMSFDKRCLREVKKLTSEIKIGLSVASDMEQSKQIKRIEGQKQNKREAWKKEIEELGFNPDAIFPPFEIVDEYFVDFFQSKGIQIFPWTVNKPQDMEHMLGLKVNGLITDFPDVAINKLFAKA